jgi:hypothetical protein
MFAYATLLLLGCEHNPAAPIIPAAVVNIRITPNPDTLVAGGTRQFTVLGTYTNTVRATSGGVSGFATVNITVSLGSASSFALLGGSGASSCTGVSSVAGNVGVDPTGTISGFPSPCAINAPGDGTVHLNDAIAASAQADVSTANSALSSVACTTDLTGQDLGGKTLAPVVYCFTSSAQLTGTVTLSGPSTGLWVFRTGSTLTTAAGARVVLGGGTLASNVYWQVGMSATRAARGACGAWSDLASLTQSAHVPSSTMR